MKLGLSSYTYGWAVSSGLSVFELLDRADEFGVTVVQVADNLPLDALSEAERARLGSELRRRQIELEVGTRGIAADRLHDYLDLCVRFDSRVLRVVVDTADHRPDPDEIVAALRALAPELETAAVVLAIENHDRFPAVVLRDIVRRIDSPHVGVCLDTANSLGANEGIVHVAETLAPFTVNLHVKDIAIERVPHVMGFIVDGRPAGEGVLDIPWLLKLVRTRSAYAAREQDDALASGGRDARARTSVEVNAILEVWTPPEDDEEATLEKERTWVRRSMEYLRRHVVEEETGG